MIDNPVGSYEYTTKNNITNSPKIGTYFHTFPQSPSKAVGSVVFFIL
jgi:hypothetical protein